MEMRIVCPTCGHSHLKQVPHEWVVDPQQHRRLELILVSQSNNTDAGRMESLVPFADDGLEFTIQGQWIDARQLKLSIGRAAKKTADGAPAEPPAPNRTREDMETEAAELGLKVIPRWNDVQLAQAIKEHKTAKDPKKLHAAIMTK